MIAKTESNINKQKPSTISVLQISEKSTSENKERDCDHQHQLKVLEKIDLSGLTCDQREHVRALIKEESSVFSVGDDDICNVTFTKWTFTSMTKLHYSKTIILSQQPCMTNQRITLKTC